MFLDCKLGESLVSSGERISALAARQGHCNHCQTNMLDISHCLWVQKMWIWVATASRIVGQQSAETNPSKGSRSLNSAPCRQLPSSCATGGPGLHQVRNQQFHCIPLLPCMSKTDRKKTTAKSFKLLSRQTPGISKTFGSHPAPPTFQGTVFNATHKF